MYLGNDVLNGQASGNIIGYGGDGHMLTIGPTRSGKSRRLLIPNLLYETGRSALVVDIKGELAAVSAAHRAARGKVVALDPFGILPSRGLNLACVGFNPMAALDPTAESFVDDAMAIAEALIQVNPNAKDPHWTESAQDLVAALVMLVRSTYGERAHLGMVRREISNSAASMDAIATEAMTADVHPAIRNKLARFAGGKDSKEIPGILSTAQTQTRFLDSPGIARNLMSNSIDFGTLKATTETIYLVLPPDKLITHAKWLRLVIGSAMTAMQRTGKAAGRPDVLFMLDEFPQLGRLQSVETAVSLNAGYGVKVWAAVQHLGQLKEHYGDNWETFLSAGCVTAFAPRDVFTRDHLTKLIGTGSKAMRSISRGSDGNTSFTDTIQKDDLVSPHQWRAMVLGEQWAFIPTDKGQVIKHIYSPDYTELPEVRAGTIRPVAA